mmetsp:Transcript_34498/g.104081  ORF Transcript_34498/g.104081 Transcript_34498/m.104081 type:complete len:189 (-) Transcript_34498:79-645(-)
MAGVGEDAGRKTFALVVAATEKWGIGKAGGLPWRLKGDMAHFKRVTTECADGTSNAVVMGRKTWESIPPKFRPLPKRLNIVLTRSVDELKAAVPPEVKVVGDLPAALAIAAATNDISKVFVIGGATVYSQALELAECAQIYLTVVKHDFECDTAMPPVDPAQFAVDPAFTKEVTEGDVTYEYRLYNRQ